MCSRICPWPRSCISRSAASGLLWCLYVPMLVVYNFTWAVNSICHMPSLGYRSFETTDHSKNNFWIGLGAFGEGYHNNHHAQAALRRPWLASGGSSI